MIPVTTAWRVLSLRMEERHPDTEVNVSLRFNAETVTRKNNRKKATKCVMAQQFAWHWAGTVSAGSQNYLKKKLFKILQ
jgi:hypothetical protein